MKKNVLDFSPSRNTIVGRILCNDPDSYEPEIVSLIKFFINQSKKHLFIDVGSNIGLFPLIASKFASNNDIPISILRMSLSLVYEQLPINYNKLMILPIT